MFIIFSVFYILIAAAMTVLILMQRGAGAEAGSGFGGGASGTVFGARGSATFLTRATGVLAGLFFLLSLGMAIYLGRTGVPSSNGLGVMSGVSAPAPKAPAKAAASTANSEVPTAAPAKAGKSAGAEVPAPAAPAKPAAGTSSGQPKSAKN